MLYRAIRKSNAHGFAFANSLASSASLETADEEDAVSAKASIESSIREGVVFFVFSDRDVSEMDRSSSKRSSV
jgi:hypothetical protein